MSELTLYGDAGSTFVRTARMICEEKEVPYTLEAAGGDELRERGLSPFGKMPAMRHGALTLHETLAIGQYVDGAFEGHPLQPTDLVERARMFGWVSALGDCVYKEVVHDWILASRHGDPDAGPPRLIRERVFQHLEVLNGALVASPFLIGNRLTLADLWLAPIASSIARAPDGEELLRKFSHLGQALQAMSARPSFIRTAP